MNRHHLALAPLVLVLALGACSTSDPDDLPLAATTETSAPAAADGPSAAASPASGAGAEADGPDWTLPIAFRPPPPERFRATDRAQDYQHWVAVDVVTDDTGERWGDIYLYRVTDVHDERSGGVLGRAATGRALADLPAFIRTSRALAVHRERRVRVAGGTGWQFDVSGTGLPVLGSSHLPEIVVGGDERITVWRVGRAWMALQVSTFRGVQRGLLAPPEVDDAHDLFLTGVRRG